MKEIILTVFDKDFCATIPGHEEMRVEESGVYHTVLVDGEKAGVVGYLSGAVNKEVYFIQVAITPKFRGVGLAGISEDLLAEHYKLPVLVATIETANTSSVRAHLKSGFQELPADKLAYLREKGFLKVGQTRLVKRYNHEL